MFYGKSYETNKCVKTYIPDSIVNVVNQFNNNIQHRLPNPTTYLPKIYLTKTGWFITRSHVLPIELVHIPRYAALDCDIHSIL